MWPRYISRNVSTQQEELSLGRTTRQGYRRFDVLDAYSARVHDADFSMNVETEGLEMILRAYKDFKLYFFCQEDK
jgi:hypothetical protein